MALPTQTIQAIAVSPGIAIGRTARITGPTGSLEPEPHKITEDEIPAELSRYNAALALTRKQLVELRQEVRNKLRSQDAEIFDAHIMLVDDRTFSAEVEKGIREKLFAAEYALYLASEHFANVFAEMPDEYLRERAADIRDVSSRILSNLTNIHVHGHEIDMDDRRIIVAHTLSPSETAGLETGKVLGFAVATGSATSHTAILARSMGLPAIVGIPPELPEQLSAEDKLIIDGFSGKLVINPDARTEEAYRLKKAEAGQIRSRLESENELRPETTDGFIVQLAERFNGFMPRLLASDPSFAARLKAIITPLLDHFIIPAGTLTPDEQDILREFYATGLLSAITAWMSLRERMPIDQFVALIVRTLAPGADSGDAPAQ